MAIILIQSDLNIYKQDLCNFFSRGIGQMDPKIYVFMSFAVREKTWLKLAHELEKYFRHFCCKGCAQ